MRMQEQIDSPELDTGAVFALLKEWAAPFHDDSSPAQVTDVLVGFTFVVGLSLAVADPAIAAALLHRLEEEMPSASASARTTAQGILDSLTAGPNGKGRPSPATPRPSPRRRGCL